jgi:hypothetical protein
MIVIHTSVIFCWLCQFFFPRNVKQKGCLFSSTFCPTHHTQAKRLTSADALYTYTHQWHCDLPWLTRHAIKIRQFLHIAAQLIHHTHHYVRKGLNHEREGRCNNSGPVLMQVSHVVLGAEKMTCWTWAVLPLPILASCLNKTCETSLKSINSKLMD